MLTPIGLALDAYMLGFPWGHEAPLPRLDAAMGGRSTMIERPDGRYRVRPWTMDQWRTVPLPERPTGTTRRGDLTGHVERVAARAG